MIHINVVGKNKINCFYITLLISMLSTSGIKAQIEKDSINTILENYFDKDQGIRQIFGEVYKKHGEGSAELQKIGQEMAQQDSINQNVVLPLLDRYGWFDGLSNKAGQCYFYVIQHSNKDIMNHYKDSVEVGYSRNYISAQEYAYFIDRLNVFQNHYQVYGTQQGIKYFSPTHHFKYIYPIVNISKLDQRRYNIGLEPISNRLKGDLLSNIEYNNTYLALIITVVEHETLMPLPNIQIFVLEKYCGETDEKGYLETYIEKEKLTDLKKLSLFLKKDTVYEKEIFWNINKDQDFCEINISLRNNNK